MPPRRTVLGLGSKWPTIVAEALAARKTAGGLGVGISESHLHATNLSCRTAAPRITFSLIPGRASAVSASVTSAGPVRLDSRHFEDGFSTDGTAESGRETASNP